VGVLIGDHPVRRIVVDWKAGTAITWKSGDSEPDALRVASPLDALDIDILRSIKVDYIPQCEPTIELGHVGLIAGCVVLAQDTGVLRGAAGGNCGVGAAVGIAEAVAPGVGGVDT